MNLEALGFRAKHVSITESGCWQWLGARYDKGDKKPAYAQVRVNYRIRLAHRWTYELANGEIPNGLVIDHLCRNTLCVNPDHMEAVTTGTNTRRGFANNDVSGMCKNRKHEIVGPEDYYYYTSRVTGTPVTVRTCKQCQADHYPRRRNHAEPAQRAARR